MMNGLIINSLIMTTAAIFS
ncbi:putative membrane protein, partial [Yersinia pestis PY-07]